MASLLVAALPLACLQECQTLLLFCMQGFMVEDRHCRPTDVVKIMATLVAFGARMEPDIVNSYLEAHAADLTPQCRQTLELLGYRQKD